MVSEVIATAWEMKLAQKMQDRQCKTRIEILNAVDNFGNCVKQLLIKGRGKFRNIMLMAQRIAAKHSC